MAVEKVMYTPYELFGWEIGKGWHPLVQDLIAELKTLGWDGHISQIKEKFGGLRFYIGSGNEKIFNTIDQAGAKSYTICEECGEPGQLRSGGWMRTLCDKHAEEKGYVEHSNEI